MCGSTTCGVLTNSQRESGMIAGTPPLENRNGTSYVIMIIIEIKMLSSQLIVNALVLVNTVISSI
jgi:hypothetical protein